MSHAPIKTSSEFADLESAVLENLQVRGVLSRLRAALEVEVRAALSGPIAAAAATTSFREHPDKHLSNALVAEYLLASGCSGALSAFCEEAGVPRPVNAPLPGASLAPPLPSVPLIFNAQNSGTEAEEDAIGAIARALAERVAEPLLAGSLAAVSAALPGGGEPSAREAVNTWLRTRRALPEKTHHLLPGGLERVVVAAELGLEIEALTVPAVMKRSTGPVSSSDVTISLPLLFALVSAARKSCADGAMAVPGWLAPGAREGLAAAAASVGSSARAAVVASALTRNSLSESSSPIHNANATAAAADGNDAAFDSDEDIPGVIARVQAANTRRDAVAATRAQANLLVRTRLGVGGRADSSNIIFAANGGAGRGLLVEGGGEV